MRIRLIAPGGRMPRWVVDGFADYHRRLPRELRFELIELPLSKRRASGDVARATAEEGARSLEAVGEGDRVIALDERGHSWSTQDLAERMGEWRMDGRDVALLIGGPDGLSADCLARAEQRWSLSPATLPHGLVRVVVVEQIYRAWSLSQGHPYHRD